VAAAYRQDIATSPKNRYRETTRGEDVGSENYGEQQGQGGYDQNQGQGGYGQDQGQNQGNY
jgi:hypothetical protein